MKQFALICRNLFVASMFDSIPGYEGTSGDGGGNINCFHFFTIYIIQFVHCKKILMV